MACAALLTHLCGTAVETPAERAHNVSADHPSPRRADHCTHAIRAPCLTSGPPGPSASSLGRSNDDMLRQTEGQGRGGWREAEAVALYPACKVRLCCGRGVQGWRLVWQCPRPGLAARVHCPALRRGCARRSRPTECCGRVQGVVEGGCVAALPRSAWRGGGKNRERLRRESWCRMGLAGVRYRSLLGLHPTCSQVPRASGTIRPLLLTSALLCLYIRLSYLPSYLLVHRSLPHVQAGRPSSCRCPTRLAPSRRPWMTDLR